MANAGGFTGSAHLIGALPSSVVADGGAGSAAASLFTSLAAQLGGIADDQARTEGARQGAVDGIAPGFKPTDSFTIRGKAYDAAGTKAYQTQTEANFTSDAMDVFTKHSDNPAAFKSAYDALTAKYRRDVEATGPHLVGDFVARATTLGTSLRLKVHGAFEDVQRDGARARLYESSSQHEQSVARLALTDPEGPATMSQARASLTKLEEQIDAMVEAGQLTELQAVQKKQETRSSTLLALYSGRAKALTDPDAIDTLHKQIRADFGSGKVPLLDADGFAKLDAGLSQLARQRRTEITAQTSAFGKVLEDYIERNAKGLVPPGAEYDALDKQARALGPQGQAMLALAKGKLDVESTMRRMGAADRAAYLSKLEADAKTSGGDIGATLAQKFQARGFSPHAAAALAGHALAESHGNTNARNAGDGADGSDSIGIFQWNSSRAAGLKAFAAARGRPISDLDVQVDYATQELRTTEAARGDALSASTSVRSASRAVISYLRPAGWSEGNPEAGHNWQGRLDTAERIARSGGVSRPVGELVEYARERASALSKLESSDPLRAAEQSGILPGGQIAPVDFSRPLDEVSSQMRGRAVQAEAVAQTYGKGAVYFRPEEKAQISDVLQGGGDKALHVLNGIVRGAGPNALKALAELGDGAPELAHSTMLAMTTGDANLQRRAAQALEARKVPGAKPPRPSQADLDDVMKSEGGMALRGMDAAARGRIMATAALVYEREAAQRGLPDDSKPLLRELVQAAAGRVRVNGADFGGFGPWTKGWFAGATETVLVPHDVRADRFADVLRTLTDADLAALKDPPVDSKGRVLTAAQLLAHAPRSVRGGYQFGNVDNVTNEIQPVRGKSGGAFALPWVAVADGLRQRMPGAFR